MFLGTFRIGERVPIEVWVRNGSGTPVNPDEAPILSVYAGGSKILSDTIPAHDQINVTGLFKFPICLDSQFSVGNHVILIKYDVSGSPVMELRTFEITPGGSIAGTGISMHYFRGSQRDVILVRTDFGVVRRLFNPRLR